MTKLQYFFTREKEIVFVQQEESVPERLCQNDYLALFNMFSIYAKINLPTLKRQENAFLKGCHMTVYTLGAKHSVKIALSGTVSKISEFLCFTQKLKTTFGKMCKMTLAIRWGLKIFSKSLYLTPLLREMHFCVLCRISR